MNVAANIITLEVDWQNNVLRILDQTKLPGKESYLSLGTAEEIREAIYQLKVRGAPAIGVAAAYGIAVCARNIKGNDVAGFENEFNRLKTYLGSSRPTAVNLFTALDRMEACVKRYRTKEVEEIKAALMREAEQIHAEDQEACRRIGEWGLKLLKPGMGILTHCNAGKLAVSGCGTALAPIYAGQEKGYHFHVFADETRPLLQGARLTAFELQRSGIEVTLICDNMASVVMKQGKIQAVLVGCDRVAANGDVANKIGTSGVAVMAKYYGIPFYVLGPTSTIDFQSPTGEAITVEERAPEEVTEKWYVQRMAPEGVQVYNPAFDVTDHSLITAIITEKGIARPPFRETLNTLIACGS
ncbi:methylthioribose-1-phosphate isomerase [Odoribacter sp. CAG:788]|nr:methylthioribose-1-phosphate isomerase [Odoribacter sp. CAG:788]